MQLQTIAFFNWLYPYGGAETVTRNLASFFHKQGYRIILYIYGQTNEKYKEDSRKSNTADRKPITYSRASNFGSKNEM